MPHLDHTGPDNKGPETGRKLGFCKKSKESDYELGQGMGLKRRSEGCKGSGKRLLSSNIL